MGVDVLATQGAKTSITMILNLICFWDEQMFARYSPSFVESNFPYYGRENWIICNLEARVDCFGWLNYTISHRVWKLLFLYCIIRCFHLVCFVIVGDMSVLPISFMFILPAQRQHGSWMKPPYDVNVIPIYRYIKENICIYVYKYILRHNMIKLCDICCWV